MMTWNTPITIDIETSSLVDHVPLLMFSIRFFDRISCSLGNQTAVQLIGAHRFSDYINANHIKVCNTQKDILHS